MFVSFFTTNLFRTCQGSPDVKQSRTYLRLCSRPHQQAPARNLPAVIPQTSEGTQVSFQGATLPWDLPLPHLLPSQVPTCPPPPCRSSEPRPQKHSIQPESARLGKAPPPASLKTHQGQGHLAVGMCPAAAPSPAAWSLRTLIQSDS